MSDLLKEAIDELGLDSKETKELIDAINAEVDAAAVGKAESYIMDEIFT